MGWDRAAAVKLYLRSEVRGASWSSAVFLCTFLHVFYSFSTPTHSIPLPLMHYGYNITPQWIVNADHKFSVSLFQWCFPTRVTYYFFLHFCTVMFSFLSCIYKIYWYLIGLHSDAIGPHWKVNHCRQVPGLHVSLLQCDWSTVLRTRLLPAERGEWCLSHSLSVTFSMLTLPSSKMHMMKGFVTMEIGNLSILPMLRQVSLSHSLSVCPPPPPPPHHSVLACMPRRLLPS